MGGRTILGLFYCFTVFLALPSVGLCKEPRNSRFLSAGTLYGEKQLGIRKNSLQQADVVPNVQVLSMSVVIEGREYAVLDLTGDLSTLKHIPITIKEGTEYRIKLTFKVNNEIVAGLRYFQTTYRKGIRVDKSNFMVGSYGPIPEPQEYLSPVEEAPSGMLARGTYTVKSRFTDDDKNIILEWECAFKITK